MSGGIRDLILTIIYNISYTIFKKKIYQYAYSIVDRKLVSVYLISCIF